MEKNDLEYLIAHYLAAEKKVETRLEACVLEKDFLAAHQYSTILNGLKKKLSVLSELDPSRRLKIQRQEIYLEHLNGKWQVEEDPRRKRMLEKFIEEAKEKISNWQTEAPVFFADQQLIDEAILDLGKGIIQGFHLVVDQREMISLDFKRIDATILRIKIIVAEKTDYSSNFWKPKKNKLQGLGFVWSAEEKGLVLDWSISQVENTQGLKLILARIFFEIFYYKEFGGTINLIIRN